MNETVETMKSKLEDVSWLAKAAAEKTTPFTTANLELMAKTLWDALKAVENCKGTK